MHQVSLRQYHHSEPVDC